MIPGSVFGHEYAFSNDLLGLNPNSIPGDIFSTLGL